MAKKLEVHKLARGMPPIPRHEMEALRDDIKRQGLLIPIVRYKGKIVDGVNRLKACKEAKIKPQFVTWKGKEEDLEAFIVGLNRRRRHATAAQWAMWATVNLLPAEKKREPERIRRSKAALKRRVEEESRKSLNGKGLQGKDSTAGVFPPQVVEEQPLGAAAIVGNRVGVGASSIFAAQAVLVAAKEDARLKDLPADVLAGRLSLAQAKKKIAAEEEGAQALKDAKDADLVREKTAEGHRKDQLFADILHEECGKDEEWKTVCSLFSKEAFKRLAVRLRWRWEGVE